MHTPSPKFKLARIVVALLAFAAAGSAAPGDAPPTPEQQLEQAIAAQPGDPTLPFFLAWLRANGGNKAGALEALERVLASGDGFLPTDATFRALAGDPAFEALKQRFAAKLPTRTDGTVVHALRERLLLPEGIAWDPVDRALYVGSIAQRAIFRIVDDGALRPLSAPADALDPILGIAVDGERRRLFAVATSALTDAGRAAPRNAIKVYDLGTGKLARSIDVKDARQLNDVAVARDGTLYVTDSAAGSVYRIDPASGDVRTLVRAGGIPGANGITTAPRGDVIYVAGNRRPVRVDAGTGETTPLLLPPRANAAVIDGLYWYRDGLVGVQNFTTTGRIVRLRLAGDGRTVTAVETLQSHHQRAFHEPTTAAIGADGIYVLARTDVTRYNARGEIDDAPGVQPPLVLKLPLP